jgi:hypothetical protein
MKTTDGTKLGRVMGLVLLLLGFRAAAARAGNSPAQR